MPTYRDPEHRIIDLRSDTITRPTSEMREAMAVADVGDDQYGEDPTVNRLEARAAEMVGKEAAVFVASGTMGNLAAVLAHCDRGDEVILGDQAHILWYESAGISAVGGIMPRTVLSDRWGQFDLDEVEQTIRDDRPGYPPTGLLCVENTYNRCSGAAVPIEHLRDLREITKRRGIPMHMDGARVFNAAASLGVPVPDITGQVDSVQFCLSKGLAAPVGSLVAGSTEFIHRVRVMRKLLGGAMRQAGVIAAAGFVALEKMVDRLPEDHRRARELAEGLSRIPNIEIDVDVVRSNILVFRPDSSIDKASFITELEHAGVRVSDYGLKGLRMVTHYEITDEDVKTTLDILESVVGRLAVEHTHVPA